MKFLPGSRSISSKLTRMNLLVSGTALLLACVAFFAYDQVSFQRNLISSLRAEARIIGLNSTSALLFDDEEAAQSTLSALGGSPDILGAAIVTNEGKIFAKYRSISQFPALEPGENQRSWVSGRRVLLADRIVLQGKPEGIVYISARLDELGGRARRYLLIAAAVLIFCLVAAMLLTATIRRLIARPIIALAEMSRAVSRDRNYSLRAPPSGDGDEIAVLIESFNEMLTQIEQRDSALSKARDELEERVQERTTELKAANRELEAFSYTVAHDLRAPLDVIIGIGFLLKQGYAESLGAEGKEMLARLEHSSAKMAVLIDDLLNLSRAGTVPLHRSSVDLSQIAESIAKDLSAAEPARKVTFDIMPGAVVLADAGLMFVALDNLLHNAWKYTSQHSSARIEFGFKRAGSRIVCFVRDDGAGFNPDLAGRLFEPFQRLHTQSDFAGTGVGLATVQRVINRHGGRVWAEGAPEQGATFYFALDA